MTSKLVRSVPLILLVGLTLAHVHAFPEGSIRIEVLSDGKPISKAWVVLLARSESKQSSDHHSATRDETIDQAPTSAAGKATFEGLDPSNEYVVRVSKPGYNVMEMTVRPHQQPIRLTLVRPETDPPASPAGELPEQSLTLENTTDYLAYVAKTGRYKNDEVARASRYLAVRTGISATSVSRAHGVVLVFKEDLVEDVRHWHEFRQQKERRADLAIEGRDWLQHTLLLNGDKGLDPVSGVSTAEYANGYEGCLDDPTTHDLVGCHSSRYLEPQLAASRIDHGG